ncbi:two-component sensor histidine kinase [Saccharothrix sp. ALI-22-I]|uniref:sensor histidine kinase n=1 Tax=Saccharothrix sp. ALI-22-I TaxID=1933778 RepID=UPI00097C86D6|nr:histidine kinase [Saccharothrix sp. ALI-22-I]ONI83626.1 two-component sensor histidine kinase [Saccharothrix sp. ALI-22-I]
MIRTLLQVVLLRDRTRVFDGFRYRRVLNALVLVYGLIMAIGISQEYVDSEEPDGWWPLLFAIYGGSFVLMLHSTLAAWRLATAGLLVTRMLMASEPDLLGLWPLTWYIPVLLAVGMIHSGRVALVVGLVTAGMVVLITGSGWTEYLVPTIGILLLVLLLGYAFGARGRAEQRFHSERDEKAALVERARIAREMHDVVAHHMSLVVVRCETAPYRITDLSEAGRREFAELGAAARAAITDMQQLLGVLRAEDQRADRTPQPGLADIRALHADASVTEAEVPEAVGLTAYRIVQEALTNAGRHAPGATTSVTVELVDGQLRVLVRNTAGGPSLGGGGGHGLRGMRERVAVHGGSMTAEPTPDGGFEVFAKIPVGVRR